MVTVHRAQGLRVVVFANDHLPAHVHVFGDGQAKINLFGPEGAPELVWAEGMTRSEVRRAIALVTAEQELLLQRWKDIHG
jgi:hypothetical protein